jgi:hypothetical protein
MVVKSFITSTPGANVIKLLNSDELFDGLVTKFSNFFL